MQYPGWRRLSLFKYVARCERLKESLTEVKTKLEEDQTLLESNQQVIAYLNKQITDNQVVQARSRGIGSWAPCRSDGAQP